MPSKSELAMAWQVRQARSKGFKGLVRKELPPEPAELDEPLEASEPTEPGPELSLAAEPAEPEPTTSKQSLLKDIVSRIRREGL